MANELTLVAGTPKTVVSSGAAVASGAMSAAPAFSYSVAADGGGFPDAEIAFSGSFAAAPTAGKILAVVARELNVDGTLDAPVPTTSYPYRKVATLVVSADTTQTLNARAHGMPRECELYLYNVDTGVSVSAGWTMKVTPISYQPAA
ncbi:MAG: hypothetical protein KDH15_18830 [Rhodocyclaceae bacterium]|nr:hypothetical protein [Rhodocyclaceae bacterium]